MHKKIISASILSADFAHLGDDAKRAIEAGVDSIHFDVMDHHFVPNLSVGAVVCKALRDAGVTVPIDVHLMVENPQDFIEPFAKAGASTLTFHPETVDELTKMVSRIHDSGMKAGLAFNPDKAINVIPEIISQVDLILMMSVYPGFAGQSFIESSLERIASARELIRQTNSNAYLGVDGGIKTSNIGAVARAGADFFVVGSGLFHSKNYKDEVIAMRRNIDG